MTPEMRSAYANLIKKVQSGEPTEAILLHTLTQPASLYVVDMQRCAPGRWLNDNLINAMVALLQV